MTELIAAISVPTSWATRSDIGDSFGVINAVVSGFGLAALIVTLRLQSRELALQRRELQMQRQSLNQSRVELFRSAEASLRTLHMDLIKMSINDPVLAAVWPSLDSGGDPVRERQHLYANLIYQHSLLSCRINDYSDEQWQNKVRYLFNSPVIRDYWRASSKARMSLMAGSQEFVSAEAADLIYNEYEELLAANRATSAVPSAGSAPEFGAGPASDEPHRWGPSESDVASLASP